MTSLTHSLTRPDAATIAYTKIESASPGLVFLHGLNSDRGGTKAEALLEHCRSLGQAFLSFDMYGHGGSLGEFSKGGISRWTDDCVAVLDKLTKGPQILVGSSMGGWVMVRAALKRLDRIAGLIGIAAAPDFTEDLVWDSLSETQRKALVEKGHIEQASDYDEASYVISRHLIEDCRKCLVLRSPMKISIPVRLIHGQRDMDVPWTTASRLAETLTSDDVDVLLVKDGDHRLSRPHDLQRLCQIVDSLLFQLENTE